MQIPVMDRQRIPVPATSLVGRQDELARLTDLLVRPDVRLVTLLGPGGVGKTRLALQIAQDIDRDDIGTVHVVPMANITEFEAVLPTIGRAVGASHLGILSLEQEIVEILGTRSMLLILDNVEQIAEHLTILSDILVTCPNVTVLTTSRVMLRLSAEHIFRVEPLQTTSAGPDHLAPATTLFVERARAVHPALPLTSENIAAIDDICRKVDGLPLAIELAAARTRFLSPIAMRARLGERLAMLVGGPRDVPERHRTLRATLAWSHDLLTDDERVLFRRLAVCINGVPYDAVAPICNATGDLGESVDHLLSALVDHSLVRIDNHLETGPRIRLLHTIREFAQEQLELAGEADAAREAHTRWFATMVIETPPDTWRMGTETLRIWTIAHEPDLETFPVVLSRLMDANLQLTALQMVTQLVPFWIELGHMRGAREWTKRVMPFVEEAAPETQQRFFYMTAIALHDANENDLAISYATRALEIAVQLGNKRMIGNSQNQLGSLYWQTGNIERGEHFQRAAIETAHQNDDEVGWAIFTSQLADQLINTGHFKRAESLLKEAIPVIKRERPDALLLSQSAMAYLTIKLDRLDEAGLNLEQGLVYHQPPPHRRPDVLSMLLFIGAMLALRRNQSPEATRLEASATRLAERIGLRILPAAQEEMQQMEQVLRTRLGPAEFTREWETGRGLSLPQAIALAIDISRLRDESPSGNNAPTPDDGLTPREREVLTLLVEGKSNAAIADALFISQRTVTTHLTRLYAKLEVTSRTEAISTAIRLGLVDPTSRS